MSLRNIILLVKDPQLTANFFKHSFGVVIRNQSEDLYEIGAEGSFPIIIKRAHNAASLSTGYSPILCLNVTNMDQSITEAIKLGAILDGPIKYPSHGKFAALRSPDGHSIGLFEPNL